jgi:hypothetical protein
MSGLELTISSKSAKLKKGERIELQGTIRNTGTEAQTLPDTNWKHIARAHLDDPKGGRFSEQKTADLVELIWVPMPQILNPGAAYPLTYQTEIFDFGNKTFGREGEEMGVYLEIPLSAASGDQKRFLYSNKITISGIHDRLP